MNKIFLFILFATILVFPGLTYADGPYLNIPPTNAFDKIHTDNGTTVHAANFSMPVSFEGIGGIKVQGNNKTHTIIINGTGQNCNATTILDQSSIKTPGVIYQNISGKTMMLVATIQLVITGGATDDADMDGYVDTVTPPTIIQHFVEITPSGVAGATHFVEHIPLVLVIPPNYYYKLDAVTTANGTANVATWFEYTNPTCGSNASSGTYKQTLANNNIINSGGNRTNYINGTGNPVHVVNDPTRNQVNVTISNSGSSGITSINSQTGPAYLINCENGNTTCTNSTNKIIIGFGINPVIINGNPQTISKALTLSQLLLGGNANGGNFNFTNLNNVNATKFYQNGKQVIDTLNSGSGISISGSGNSRTITNTGVLSAITSINGDPTAAQTINASSPITITNSGAVHTIKCPTCSTNSGNITGSGSADQVSYFTTSTNIKGGTDLLWDSTNKILKGLTDITTSLGTSSIKFLNIFTSVLNATSTKTNTIAASTGSTVTMTGLTLANNEDANSHKIINLAQPTLSTDAQASNYLGIIGNLTTSKCTNNQIIKYNSTSQKWECRTSPQLTTTEIDLSTTAYNKVVDNPNSGTNITATAKPGSPQFTYTIQAGDIPSDTSHVSDYMVFLAIAVKNNIASSKTINWHATLNGVEIAGADASTTNQASDYEQIGMRFGANAIHVGDVIGVKFWNTSSANDYKYMDSTIYITPRIFLQNYNFYGVGAETFTQSGAIGGVSYISGATMTNTESLSTNAGLASGTNRLLSSLGLFQSNLQTDNHSVSSGGNLVAESLQKIILTRYMVVVNLS